MRSTSKEGCRREDDASYTRNRIAPSIGLACGGLQVALPISPSKLLFLYDSDVYQTAGGPGLVDLFDRKEVQSLNALQFAAAEHAVFYKNASSTTRINEISATVRDNRLGVEGSRFANEEDANSHLIQVANIPLNVDLVRGAIQMRHRAYSIAKYERTRTWRPAAAALARSLHPPSDERGRKAAEGKRFKRVID